MTSALGGGEGPAKADADVERKLSKGGCMNLRTRGGGGSKSQNFLDVILVSPLTSLIVDQVSWAKTMHRCRLQHNFQPALLKTFSGQACC